MAAVRKKDAAQGVRAGCRNHLGAEALAHKRGHIAAVIQVRVGQQNGVDFVHVDGQRLPVHQAQLLEPLEQTAIDEYAMASGRQQKLAARDRASSAKESENRDWDIHDAVLISA